MPADAAAAGAVELCKLAGLLPAAVCLPPSAEAPEVAVPLDAVRRYRELEALSLRPVGEARVPLADAGDARVVAFRPADGGPEQLAILVGEPEAAAEPLCRLHSECFTGDLLGSLRCDCGEQLRGAIRRMADGGGGGAALPGAGGARDRAREQAAGLRAAGRRARHGGREHAPRLRAGRARYGAAATMLRHLGIGRVRLLTNNPAKLRQLASLRHPDRGPGAARLRAQPAQPRLPADQGYAAADTCWTWPLNMPKVSRYT